MDQVAPIIGSDQRHERKWLLRLSFTVGCYALVFLGAAGITKAWLVRDKWRVGAFAFSMESEYVPAFADSAGKELMLVYIGKLNCAPSNSPSVRTSVERLKAALQKQARAGGRSFIAVGVGADWKVEEALQHLALFGPFDEVIAGRSWANSAAVKFMSQDYPGPVATPQILLIERDYQTRTSDKPYTPRIFRNERLLSRKVGVQEIAEWATSYPTGTASSMR